MTIKRHVIPSLLLQGVNERIAYLITTTPWGSNPTDITVAAYCDGKDVTATVLTGAASVEGDAITLPALHSLTAGSVYTIPVKFVVKGNTVEAIVTVVGE
mgnify:CR=1 FL=1